ncbi:hypothetical protein HOE22_05905 [Candidatus Woesearchaeota archaeon]|mgnify:FL=1|jgi:hypothetical protein|nr:hypothetical protein [Candidatus Woesearchaeota archaeon]|tara:strand:+ start:556 stop:849 length:294 start_codon:yes stop_codon:yes gene_type:complete
MEQTRWSEYSRYLVLSDKAGHKLRGNYYSYQDYQVVRSVIERLSITDNTTYTYDDTIYNRKITSTEAKSIINNLEIGKWTKINEKMLLVGNQLGLRV